MSLSVPYNVRKRVDRLSKELGHSSRSETVLPWIISRLKAAEKKAGIKEKKG